MRPLRTELHVPVGYLATTIIDGKDLFQVRTPSSHQNGVEPDYEGTFYTNDSEYVNRTSNMLKDIWKNARTPPKSWPKRALKFYANAGHAVIHPPESFNLPDFMIRAVHENKQSSFGTT